MELNDNRSYKIQLLRGLAIIAVVFIHNTPSGTLQIWVRPFLNFTVGLFLALSGMLSNAAKWKPWKRIKKVLIPYAIWTLIYSVLYWFQDYPIFPDLIPKWFLKALFTGQASAVMYYPFLYWEFTLLLPLIDRLARSKYRYLGFLISPVDIIIMRLFPLIFGYQLNSVLDTIQEISCLGWFTYYYLGYMLGNRLITLKLSTVKLSLIWAATILIQMAEGYWYYFGLGKTNCGTQMKLSAVLTGAVVVMIAYRLICSEKTVHLKLLHLIGDYSFGIFFSHLAVGYVMKRLPFYPSWIVYPWSAILVVLVSLLCVLVGNKILGKYAKYMALSR